MMVHILKENSCSSNIKENKNLTVMRKKVPNDGL